MIHVLPGDSLTADLSKTGISGEVVVCRECFVVGDLSGETLDEFWRVRSAFLEMEYGGDPIEYQEGVVFELEKLLDIDDETEVNLWFENELFCQANMWFCLCILQGRENIYRVAPADISNDDIWNGFRGHDEALLAKCFETRVKFSPADIEIGRKLWNAFRTRDVEMLRSLSDHRSPCFPMLKQSAEAAAEIDTRPLEIIRSIMDSGVSGFDDIFVEFQKHGGVFGFGDLQVERLLKKF